MEEFKKEIWLTIKEKVKVNLGGLMEHIKLECLKMIEDMVKEE